MLVCFAAPGRSVARSNLLRVRRVEEAHPYPSGKEKELLRALERHEEITAARAALETSMSVTEAEKMLGKLASGGHLEVRARGGTLAYALRPADRRQAGPKEIEGAGNGPVE